MAESGNNEQPRTDKMINALLYVSGGGVVISLLYSLQGSNANQVISVLGVAMAVSIAALLTGGLIGFLFGVPKTLQEGIDSTPQSPGDATNKSKTNVPRYGQNTSLEQISDWLTKILVGVGLTQLADVPSYLHRYAAFAAPGMGGFTNSELFSIGLLIFYLICGFVISYLWTRLHLAPDLLRMSFSSMMTDFGSTLSTSIMTEVKEINENDVRAKNLVFRQLHPTSEYQTITQEELNKAILDASGVARSVVYYQAETMRHENWEDPSRRHKMELTIPIFRALIAADTKKEYHKNYGQLGFAVMEQSSPDYKEAINMLSTAIKLRKPEDKIEWLDYERNRVICMIRTDENYAKQKPSSEEVKKAILADLKEICLAPDKGEKFRIHSDVDAWVKLNNVTWGQF